MFFVCMLVLYIQNVFLQTEGELWETFSIFKTGTQVKINKLISKKYKYLVLVCD